MTSSYAAHEAEAFRESFFRALLRTSDGTPALPPHWVAHQGKKVRLLDLRTEPQVVGLSGYIPGAEWLPRPNLEELLEQVAPEECVVLISSHGDDAASLARGLKENGRLHAAALAGGIAAWRAQGYATARDNALLLPEHRARGTHRAVEVLDGAPALADIRAHLGDPSSTRWMKAGTISTTGSIACIDGRDDTAIVAAPGGDIGQLLLLLSALENTTGRLVSKDTLAALFPRRLDAFGGCYLHTDAHAEAALLGAIAKEPRLRHIVENDPSPLAWRRYFAAPEPELKDDLLEFLVLPEHVGCGHIKAMLTRSEEYEIRPELVRETLRQFLRAHWSELEEPHYVVLPGDHGECGILVVKTEAPVQAWAPIPLVSPSTDHGQLFILHADVAHHFRRQLAAFAWHHRELLGTPAQEVLEVEIERLAEKRANLTLARLAPGLPIFEALFHRDKSIDVREAGRVPVAP